MVSAAGAAAAVAAEAKYFRGLGAAVAVFNGIYAILWIVTGIEAAKGSLPDKPKTGG